MNLGTIRRYYVEKWSEILKKRKEKKEINVTATIEER